MELWDTPKVELNIPLRGWDIDVNTNKSISSTYYAGQNCISFKKWRKHLNSRI